LKEEIFIRQSPAAGTCLHSLNANPLSSHKPLEVLGQRLQQIVDGSVIAKRLADVSKAVDVARTEDKATAQLKRVLAQAMLTVSCGACSLAGDRVVTAQQVKKRATAQAGHAISLATLVDKQRKRDGSVFAEHARVVLVAESNGRETRTLLPECRFVFAQLRDVLAAEYSTVMPQEDKHGGAFCPKRTQHHAGPVRIRQNDAGETPAKRLLHHSLFSE
jgi:hypothetical protein